MNGADTYKMMKMAHGNACLALSNIFEWFGRFWKGWESSEDEARAGCPHTNQSVNNIKRVRATLKTD